MKRGILFCRGISVDRIDEVTDKEFDFYAVVNSFSEVLMKEKFKEYFLNRPFVHYVNRSNTAALSKEDYETFPVKYCQMNVFKDEYDNKSSLRPVLESYGVETRELPDSIKIYSDTRGKFLSTGMMSLIHMAVCLNIKDITTFGMDMYETDYFTQNLTWKTVKVQDYQKEKFKNLHIWITEFLKTQKDKTFTFYTNSKLFNPNLENVNIIRR